MGSETQAPVYKPLERAATVLRWLFLAIAGLAVVMVVFRLMERSLLNDVSNVSAEEARTSDVRVTGLAVAFLIASVGTGLLFIFWFHRAYGNLIALGRERLRFSPGWAIGSWFIPLAQLVIPKILANDLWRGSDPASESGDRWKGRPVPGFVHAWWGLFIAGNLLARLSGGLTENVSDVDGAKTLNLLAVLGALCWLVSALGAYHLVGRITEGQRRLTEPGRGTERASWERIAVLVGSALAAVAATTTGVAIVAAGAEPDRGETGTVAVPPATTSVTPTDSSARAPDGTPDAQSGPEPLAAGSLQGLAGHSALGTVELFLATDSSFVLRFDSVDVEETPDPRVYLLAGVDQQAPAGDELGALPGHIGSFELRIPGGVAPRAGLTVLIWDRALGSPVANATLT